MAKHNFNNTSPGNNSFDNAYGGIEAFKANIRSIQRSSLFVVEILSLPPDIPGSMNPSKTTENKSGNANITKTYTGVSNIGFYVKAATFPAAEVGTIEIPYMGRKVKFYGDRTYGSWQTTVILDGNWHVYETLYAWNQALNGAQRIVSDRMNMHENFKVDAYITSFTTHGMVSRQAQLHGLWIKSIGEISMDWSSTDNPVDLSVTWEYDYVTTVDPDNKITNDFEGYNS